MKEQIISIAPNGTVYGLDFKSKGVPLREFGAVCIERITSIEWSETRQKWFIKWQHSRHVVDHHDRWRMNLFQIAEVSIDDFSAEFFNESEHAFCTFNPVMFFERYEDANAAEIEVIQSLRTKGIIDA
jgi:hypothetical protein